MSEHVWKIGDWAQYGSQRLLCWDVTTGGEAKFIDTGGCSDWLGSYKFEHLPNCTGWKWKAEPLQLKEGCWYERRDGKVVGPIERYHENSLQWYADGVCYSDNGTFHPHSNSKLDLIREVPAPVPKYRPFRDDEAYAHCGKVLKGKNGGWGRALVVCVNDDDTIVIGDENVRQRYAFEHYTFEDDSPFGVKVDE